MHKRDSGLRVPTSSAALMQRPAWLPQVLSDLKRHEGFRKYAYPDPLSPMARKYRGSKYRWGHRPALEIMAEFGIPLSEIPSGKPWTIGYGFTRGVNERMVITKEYADRRLETIALEHAAGLDKLLPGWRTNLPQYVQEVLANLIFNLGKERLSQFTTTLGLIEQGKYAMAGQNLKKSLWYKQVGSRARELTERLITGQVQEHYKV